MMNSIALAFNSKVNFSSSWDVVSNESSSKYQPISIFIVHPTSFPIMFIALFEHYFNRMDGDHSNSSTMGNLMTLDQVIMCLSQEGCILKHKIVIFLWLVPPFINLIFGVFRDLSRAIDRVLSGQQAPQLQKPRYSSLSIMFLDYFCINF